MQNKPRTRRPLNKNERKDLPCELSISDSSSIPVNSQYQPLKRFVILPHTTSNNSVNEQVPL